MSEQTGTKIYAPIRRADTNSPFEAMDSNEVKGGVHVVNTIEERDAIPDWFRKEGLEVYVISNDTKYYLKGGITNAHWTIPAQSDSTLQIEQRDTMYGVNTHRIGYLLSASSNLNGRSKDVTGFPCPRHSG